MLCSYLLGASVLVYSDNRYAENFKIENYDGYRLLQISNPWRGSGEISQSYALIEKGHPLPDLPRHVRIIRTPVERIVIMATVYLGPIQSLKAQDRIVGLAFAHLANDPVILAALEGGAIKAIQGGAALDIETLLRLEPDLILTSTSGDSTYDDYPKMERAGLPAVLTAGWMESHPLARAEWIKVIAAFLNQEAEATQLFDASVQRYEALTTLTATLQERPTLFSNAPYGGIWHLPGGQSYNAQAFADAGAIYLWTDDDSAGGIPLDMESVLFRAANADFWINPGAYQSLADLGSLDPRFIGFRAFREGNVFNNTLQVNPQGGNNIWERGINRPEEVLADLIKIFHPDLLPEHEFIYYERLK